MKPGHILRIILIILAVVVSGCNKFDDEVLLGTWISMDKADTLYFVDNSNFFKSSAAMRYDHFDYRLDRDSIEIKYSGRLYVFVYPTRHKYYLESGRLTIDFTNKLCYGFSKEEITFVRQ